ncbi:MAG TPA: 16S rRNA (cytosine(1402)-N(4))-methyltransferase RsmH [Candidatus Paceibacterota bacterium]
MKDKSKIQSIHKTVLLKETIDGLLARQSLGVGGNEKLLVVDGTFGGGGHSAFICEKFPGTKIIAIDQDKSAWSKARNKFESLDCDISFHNANFRDMDKVLQKEKAEKVDGIILDLGLSSDQLENSGRGFSFMKDEPLLMTMKDNPSPEDLTAGDIVNTWSEESLEKIIRGYGEERFARRIAEKIVEARKERPIKTTFDLVKIIGGRPGKIHPATRTFQAIRIAVNDELGTLSAGLAKGFEALKVGGRMAVITFHSLEDRVVKRFYKNKEKEGKATLINKKPIIATNQEIKSNPRSRSAKLRIIEKI